MSILPAKTASERPTQKYPPKSISTAWRARLLKSGGKNPHPLGNVANAITAFAHAPIWQGVLGFNESTLTTTALAKPPWDDARTPPFAWTDADDTRAAAWLQQAEIGVGKDIASQAIQAVACSHPFHPIRDYLDSREWDGIERLKNWLPNYLGTESTTYTRAVGPRILIGAVARIYQPGCKLDTIPVFEGLQGTRKSMGLRTLAGDEWFTDEIADLGSKDCAMQMRGVWIIELAELDAMTRSEVSRVKAFTSRQADRFRPPYGRRIIKAPRECIFVGTVNHSTYLRDETGARRFWPVKTGRIKIDDLARDRDQLWAEARDRFRDGSPWWLEDRHIVKLASLEQAARYEADPWDSKIAAYVENRESVTVAEILEKCICKPGEQWGQQDQNRIARTLVSFGWERYRARNGTAREWRYRRASS